MLVAVGIAALNNRTWHVICSRFPLSRCGVSEASGNSSSGERWFSSSKSSGNSPGEGDTADARGWFGFDLCVNGAILQPCRDSRGGR